jgi:hypothetical protein
MAFKFEYLGKFEFILKNILGKESGAQQHAIDEKNRSQKSHASVPLSFQSRHLYYRSLYLKAPFLDELYSFSDEGFPKNKDKDDSLGKLFLK